ncbi:hypothetical protein [Niallia sp. FSL M8-0099]|uniref:hypothetical protein n=1 Tax=Niallia sp. FSL M8-0099 TaxID=2954519 RepID=UPI0030F7A1E9
MKKQYVISSTILISLCLILTILTIYALSSTPSIPNQAYSQAEPITSETNSSYEIITATVISKTSDGLFYTAVNNNDPDDIVVIEGSFAKGDKVQITFFHDDIESVDILERETF